MTPKPLTEAQQEVLDYITAHPGLTAEDVASEYGNTEEVYNAIGYLVWNALLVERAPVTHALTARIR